MSFLLVVSPSPFRREALVFKFKVSRVKPPSIIGSLIFCHFKGCKPLLAVFLFHTKIQLFKISLNFGWNLKKGEIDHVKILFDVLGCVKVNCPPFELCLPLSPLYFFNKRFPKWHQEWFSSFIERQDQICGGSSTTLRPKAKQSNRYPILISRGLYQDLRHLQRSE